MSVKKEVKINVLEKFQDEMRIRNFWPRPPARPVV